MPAVAMFFSDGGQENAGHFTTEAANCNSISAAVAPIEAMEISDINIGIKAIFASGKFDNICLKNLSMISFLGSRRLQRR